MKGEGWKIVWVDKRTIKIKLETQKEQKERRNIIKRNFISWKILKMRRWYQNTWNKSKWKINSLINLLMLNKERTFQQSIKFTIRKKLQRFNAVKMLYYPQKNQ